MMDGNWPGLKIVSDILKVPRTYPTTYQVIVAFSVFT
jgi:hypothetical protein